jgi:hypothetical protein
VIDKSEGFENAPSHFCRASELVDLRGGEPFPFRGGRRDGTDIQHHPGPLNPIPGYSARSECHNTAVFVFETHSFFWPSCNLPSEKPSKSLNVILVAVSPLQGQKDTVPLCSFAAKSFLFRVMPPSNAMAHRPGGPARLSTVCLVVVLTGRC